MKQIDKRLQSVKQREIQWLSDKNRRGFTTEVSKKDKETDRQTDRQIQTQAQACGERERQTDRQIQAQTQAWGEGQRERSVIQSFTRSKGLSTTPTSSPKSVQFCTSHTMFQPPQPLLKSILIVRDRYSVELWNDGLWEVLDPEKFPSCQLHLRFRWGGFVVVVVVVCFCFVF